MDRRSTPAVPPGLSLPPHSQSPTATQVQQPGAVAKILSVAVPSVPEIQATATHQKVATPKKEMLKSKPIAKSDSKTDGGPVDGSPAKKSAMRPSKSVETSAVNSASPVKPKKPSKKTTAESSKATHEQKKTETGPQSKFQDAEIKTKGNFEQATAIDGAENITKELVNSILPSPPQTTYAKSVGKKPAPGTLTLNTTTFSSNDISSIALARGDIARISRPPSVAPSITSRPQTPSLEALNTPIKRTAQPRTLRITETPRTATPPAFPVVDAVPQSSAQAGSKVSSRRPSLTSINHPGTPLSEIIDMFSLPSASRDVSRANSPPPLMSKKRGEKKPKKTRRVQTESDVLEVEISKIEEEQVPILGRKKKTKKPDVGLVKVPLVKKKDTEDLLPKRAASSPPQQPVQIPVVEEFDLPSEPVSQSKVTPKREPSPESSHTKSKRLTDSLFAALGPELEKVVHSAFTKPVSMNSHLRSLDYQAGPNQRPFSHSSDLDAYVAAQDPFVLSPADYAVRSSGQPIRRSAEDGRLSSRVLETPRGTRLRCLTEQEEQHLVELEDKICTLVGSGFWGGGSLEYAIAGMPGYDRKQKQQAIDTLSKLFPRGISSIESTRSDNIIHSVGGNEDPARLINQFIFTQETEAITPMVPYAGEKAHIQQQQREQAASTPVPTAAEYQRSQEAGQRSMADSAAEAANAAARAAAAIGNTRGVIEQAMASDTSASGTVLGYPSVEDSERVWQEEKRHAEGLERRLNGVVKRNRKVLTGVN